jgi:putative FmdB family regulatory protein
VDIRPDTLVSAVPCANSRKRFYDERVPIYEYRCSGCEETLEVIVLPREEPPAACPSCGGELERRWSRVGIQLVGWGFAKNDALLPEGRGRKDYRQVKDKAAELFD